MRKNKQETYKNKIFTVATSSNLSKSTLKHFAVEPLVYLRKLISL